MWEAWEGRQCHKERKENFVQLTIVNLMFLVGGSSCCGTSPEFGGSCCMMKTRDHGTRGILSLHVVYSLGSFAVHPLRLVCPVKSLAF